MAVVEMSTLRVGDAVVYTAAGTATREPGVVKMVGQVYVFVSYGLLKPALATSPEDLSQDLSKDEQALVNRWLEEEADAIEKWDGII